MTDSALNELSIQRFQEYLRVPTEQPNPDYYACKEFLFKYAEELGLRAWAHECVPGKPIVGMTLEGQNSALPAILLWSHTDVVPAAREFWKHPPFEAFKDQNGDIYARGAQDMKCVGVWYLEALRRLLKNSNKVQMPFMRTIHICWGPDEEIGSHDGMERFIDTDVFKSLNIGFGLDEGLASETDEYRVFYGERSVWWFHVRFPGSPGHGSRLDIENTAGPKLTSFLYDVNLFREQQRARLLDRSSGQLKLGDLTSINLTKIEGGVQINVLPVELVAHFDMRVTPTDHFDDVEAMIRKWCSNAGDDVTYEFIQKGMSSAASPTTSDHPFWAAFERVLTNENCRFAKEIFIGGTDARFLRERGIPSIGFSPINNTPILLHDHNEFLNDKVFLRGIEIYEKLIEALANV